MSFLERFQSFSLNKISRRQAIVGLSVISLTACSKTETPQTKVVTYYTCTMHPFVRSQDPKGRCPVCGMSLVPVYGNGDSKETDADSKEVTTIAPEKLQEIGATTEVIGKRDLTQHLVAPAAVEMDESSLVDINVKEVGYVTKLYANSEGMSFSKGQPLMTVNCPGWIQAQLAYIQAYRVWKKGGGDELANELEVRRTRLELWSLPDEQVPELEKVAMGTKDLKTLSDVLDITAPFDGYIHKKKAMEGMRFEAGQSLLEFAGHGKVWVVARFPENLRMNLSVGQTVTVKFPFMPEHTVHGAIDFIDAHVDEHQVMARIIVTDEGHMFHPGMLAEVESEILLGNVLAVPSSALLPTGNKYIAFIDHGGGQLEPREVQVGLLSGDYYAVTSGLTEGDKVVTGANFLIDAESRIQGVLKTWGTNP